MNTFCQVIQKQSATSYELYNHKMTELNGLASFEFHGVANKYEYADYSTSSRLLKTLRFVFAASPIACTIKTKFDYFKTVIDNIFISSATKELFIESFCESQRIYHILCKFANKFKRKRAPLRVQTDLFLNNIHMAQSNVITIFQNGQNYLFTIGDLTNIIDTALAHSYAFFSTPNVIKNPYNNMPFSKSILYSIYFCINQRNYVLSQLFHAYFLCNFNLTKMRSENEVLIRKMYIAHYITKGNVDDLRKSVLKMIRRSSFAKKIYIDKTFPTLQLVGIMRPYLQLYFDAHYSLDMNIKYQSRYELHKRLRAFYKFNPTFGRKYLKGTSSIVTYCDKHIQFKPINSLKYYDRSHLGIIQEHNESDNESDNESVSDNGEEAEATFSDDEIF